MRGKVLLQADIDPSEIGKNYPADVGLIGDIRQVLLELGFQLERDLLSGDVPLDREARVKAVEALKAATPRCVDAGRMDDLWVPLKPQRVIAESAGRCPTTPSSSSTSATSWPGPCTTTTVRSRGPSSSTWALAPWATPWRRHRRQARAEVQTESAQVTKLQCEIEANLRDPGIAAEPLMRAVATLAMYRPLHAMSGVDTLLASEPMSAGIERLIHRSVRNVLEERRLRSGIRAIGGITEAVSQAVRAQYEENPYPRWLSFDRMPPVAASQWLEVEVPGLQTLNEFPLPLRLLVAGCGTGVNARARHSDRRRPSDGR